MRWLLALFLTMSLAHAAQTYVIAAGVETYEDERISGLKYAAADARSVAAVFRGAGAGEKAVVVLTSEPRANERKATRSIVLAALERVREQAGPDDHLVVFFAGHGVEQNGEQYLLTVDARRSLISDTALPLKLVGKALDGLQAKEVLFLIDACRSDPQAGRADTDAKLSDGLARGLRPVLLPAANGPKSVVATLLACDVGQRAWEDPETSHGVFTSFLLRALGGEAVTDGKVTLTSLARYLQQKVGAWGERTNRPQRPRLVNPDGGDMLVLTAPTEPVVSVQLANQPLTTVVNLLGEQYGVQIALGKGVNAEAKVTGRLEGLPLSQALRVLLAAYDLRVRKDGNVYVIEGKGATPEPTPVAPATNQTPFALPDYLSKWQSQMPPMQYRIRAKDGMPQVLIPAGEFRLGSPDGQGSRDEHPQQLVMLSPYWLDLHAVTVAQYRLFSRATGQAMPAKPAWGWLDHHPVVNVSWPDAAAYAKWVGGSLPTEAQWEKAARGGLENKVYAWGDEPPEGRAVSNGGQSTAPVGTCAPNGYGLFDMAGNTWQWCQDYYIGYWYQQMADKDPVNTSPTPHRVLRGGGCNYQAALRVATRNAHEPDFRMGDLGFRVAQPQ